MGQFSEWFTPGRGVISQVAIHSKIHTEIHMKNVENDRWPLTTMDRWVPSHLAQGTVATYQDPFGSRGPPPLSSTLCSPPISASITANPPGPAFGGGHILFTLNPTLVNNSLHCFSLLCMELNVVRLISANASNPLHPVAGSTASQIRTFE